MAATAAPAAAAPQACDPWSATFAGGVPTAKEVIGIDLGERDVTTAESDAYLLAVDRASSRVTSGVLARSVQGSATPTTSSAGATRCCSTSPAATRASG
jgi:hypothetical protein